MPPALWLITLPLGAAPVIYLFRRVGIGGVAAAVVALVSAWLTIQAPPGQILQIFGRSIALDQFSQAVLTILFVSTAVLFLISTVSVPFISGLRRKTVEADTLRGAGRTFYPLSLGMLALFVATTLTHHLGIRAIFVEVAALLAVFIIQGSRLDSVRAAQRFLIFISLSLPLLLVVSWQLDLVQLSDTLLSSRFLRLTALLAGGGFALWLAIVPFHSWLITTANEASPASAAFLFITFPAIALLCLIQLLADASWLLTSSQLGWAMVVAGLATVVVGGGMTAVQRGYSGLLGYAALYDLGCLILLLGLGGPALTLVIVAGLGLRALALSLIASAISAIRLAVGADGFAQATGMAAKLPVATAGLIIGGLTLAGTPLTLGFALRWQLIQSLAVVEPRWSLLLVLAGLGVAVGYLRGVYALLPAGDSAQADAPATQITATEPYLLLVITVLLLVACLALGIFPGWLIEPLRALLLPL